MSTVTGASLGCTKGFPTRHGTRRQKCEKGNQLNDGYTYVFNKRRGTKKAICHGTCWCCRQAALAAAPRTLMKSSSHVRNKLKKTSRNRANGSRSKNVYDKIRKVI